MTFWKDTQHANAGPLTLEAIRAAIKAVQEDHGVRRCAHIHSFTYVRRLRAQGLTEVHCRWCGALCTLPK